jgi:hypothetical protein
VGIKSRGTRFMHKEEARKEKGEEMEGGMGIE